uniref:Acrosin-binding protein n=1 Tax=Geospiza parvula TaxID=87175 RepID=A0A8U8AQ55_GEOPR
PLTPCTLFSTSAQEPGTPLSDQEYHQFFKFLRITIQARTACELRELYGCKNSLVQRLDEYENHGVIPPALFPSSHSQSS